MAFLEESQGGEDSSARLVFKSNIVKSYQKPLPNASLKVKYPGEEAHEQVELFFPYVHSFKITLRKLRSAPVLMIYRFRTSLLLSVVEHHGF